jgi:hypothetical protein
MKYEVYGDEFYPVLILNNEGDPEEIEFSEEELADIRKVEAEFNRIQKMLGKKAGYEDHESGFHEFKLIKDQKYKVAPPPNQEQLSRMRNLLDSKSIVN